MQHKARLFLLDIVDYSSELLSMVDGASREDFMQDRKLILACERSIFIIGEAVVQAAKFEPDLVHQISHFQQIVSLRNLLAHAYFNAQPERLYQLFSQDIPKLKEEVQAILDA